ncbi:MAG: type II toxin-antitoxin system Phd/YefM family antitoxin [Acidimicrobiia bacterium]
MKVFSINEMKADFSRLLRRVTAGEEVLIKRAGTPVARLVPVEPRALRVLGIDAGKFTVPDDFNNPITEDGSDLFVP